MDSEHLHGEFERAMRSIFDDACKVGYRPTYFLRMLNDLGPLETASRLLDTPQVSEGFTRLWELGRLDLSVEAVALKPEFRGLFTQDQLKRASERLDSLGYHGHR